MAGLVTELRASGSLGLILVGNTFYELDNPPGHLVEQEHEKAAAIAQVLEKLQPAALLPGQRDVDVGGARLQDYANNFKLPVLSGLRGLGQQRFKADSVLVTIAGHKVGFIGLGGRRCGPSRRLHSGSTCFETAGSSHCDRDRTWRC